MNVDADELAEISDGFVSLLVGKNKRLVIVAAVSVAVSAGRMVGMTKLDLQELPTELKKRYEEEHGNH